MIDDIEAEEYYFVSHANYKELHREHGGYIPPIDNPKLTHYIGVSQFATDKLEEYRKKIGKDIKTIKCYNPLTLEPKQKLIHLVSACRLDDTVKGGGRTLKLIEALDRYCAEHNRNYIWTIFTNPTKIKINSPNVIQMEPRLDVRTFIADADYVLQLSNDMETYCYTINEALGYGVPIITTPLSILKELPITDNEHIVLDWDCENADEVARQIFEKEVKPFEYTPLKDDWDKILAKGRSNYKSDWKKTYLVECIEAYTDVVINKWIETGEQWEVDYLRMEYLNDLGLIKVIKEI